MLAKIYTSHEAVAVNVIIGAEGVYVHYVLTYPRTFWVTKLNRGKSFAGT